MVNKNILVFCSLAGGVSLSLGVDDENDKDVQVSQNGDVSITATEVERSMRVIPPVNVGINASSMDVFAEDPRASARYWSSHYDENRNTPWDEEVYVYSDIRHSWRKGEECIEYIKDRALKTIESAGNDQEKVKKAKDVLDFAKKQVAKWIKYFDKHLDDENGMILTHRVELMIRKELYEKITAELLHIIQQTISGEAEVINE